MVLGGFFASSKIFLLVFRRNIFEGDTHEFSSVFRLLALAIGSSHCTVLARSCACLLLATRGGRPRPEDRGNLTLTRSRWHRRTSWWQDDRLGRDHRLCAQARHRMGIGRSGLEEWQEERALQVVIKRLERPGEERPIGRYEQCPICEHIRAEGPPGPYGEGGKDGHDAATDQAIHIVWPAIRFQDAGKQERHDRNGDREQSGKRHRVSPI